MKKVGRELKEKLTCFLIFPEGTLYQEDNVMPFKKGEFHLAIQAQVPIVPVVIGNYRNVLDPKAKRFDGGVIRIKCLPPIKNNGFTVVNVNDLIEKVHKIVSNCFDVDLKAHVELYEMTKVE